MQQIRADILSDEIIKRADAICFTSNGVLKKDGTLVMGAGVAKIFRDKFSGLDSLAGEIVNKRGSICQIAAIGYEIPDNILPRALNIVAFPTKYHWKDPSDALLIEQSAKQLVELADFSGWKAVYLPRPGCANGGLKWAFVKQILEPILDDRFIITTFG